MTEMDQLNRFLVIGSGGREHAIVKALYRTRSKDTLDDLYVSCIGTWVNPGIVELVGEEAYYEIDHMYETNVGRMVQIALELKIEMVIVGSEDQLAMGVVNEMKNVGIRSFGPTRKMAMIETSKIFMRELLSYDMERHTPKWKYYNKYNEKTYGYSNSNKTITECTQKEYEQCVDELTELFTTEFNYNYVIKADGLKGGKGVKVYGEHLHDLGESIEYSLELLKGRDDQILIEEKLEGQEFSLMTLFDINGNPAHLPIVQDYKRLLNNNKGPNTGGMGSIIFNATNDNRLPFLTQKDIMTAQRINEDVFDLLLQYNRKDENDEYLGVLYGSFMKTTDGRIMIIEYNARFGDPEAINLMHLLETDLSQIITAMYNGTLNKIDIKFKSEYCVSCYATPIGYPEQKITDQIIEIDPSLLSHDCLIYASIVKNNDPKLDTNDDNKYLMLGSRALAIVVSGTDLSQILNMVDNYYKLINGPYYRRNDIGHEYNMQPTIIAYKDAGVNIDEGNKVVECIKESVKSTFNDNVIKGQYGNFGGSYKMDDEYTLVTSMDGVGTKVQMVLNLLPREEGFESLGYDLFSSNINDILCLGKKVEPMFFLDYFGCQKLNHQDVYHVVKGLSKACRESNCVLIGGETAELKNFSPMWENWRRVQAGVKPLSSSSSSNSLSSLANVSSGNSINTLENTTTLSTEDIIPSDNYELVGTIVGKMKESMRFKAERIKEGDLVVALRSTGLHTNGYSLVNKLITEHKLDGVKWRDVLCNTHKNYYRDLEKIWQTDIDVKGICHITGGGLKHNPCRILPEHVEIKWNQWEIPEIFLEIQRVSKISYDVLLETFNCGIGLILIVESNNDYQRLKDIFGDELMNVGIIFNKY